MSWIERKVKTAKRERLEQTVATLVELCFRDEDTNHWDPDRKIDGTELVDELKSLLYVSRFIPPEGPDED